MNTISKSANTQNGSGALSKIDGGEEDEADKEEEGDSNAVTESEMANKSKRPRMRIKWLFVLPFLCSAQMKWISLKELIFTYFHLGSPN